MIEKLNPKPLLIITIIAVLSAIATVYKTYSTPSNSITLTKTDIPTQPPISSSYTPAPALQKKILIQLTGQVPNPGIYQVTPNQRIHDILIQTGGLLPNADSQKINLTAKIKDGMHIKIPEKKAPTSPKKPTQKKEKSTPQKKAPKKSKTISATTPPPTLKINTR